MGKHKQQQHKGQRPKKNRSSRPKFTTIPDKSYYSLRHVVRSQITGTAFSVFNFEALSMQTLQPMYRDQLLGLWSRYVVHGVTVEHRIVNKSTTVDMECLTYHGNGNTIVALTFAQALEYKYTRRKLLTTSGNAKSLTIRQTIFFNSFLPAHYFDDSNFWGSSTAAPPYCINDGYQYAIGFFSADGTSTMAATMDRKITFHVQLMQLHPTSNSFALDADRPVLQYTKSDSDDCSNSEHSEDDDAKAVKVKFKNKNTTKGAVLATQSKKK